MKKKLVPLAEDINRISARQVLPEDLLTTRKVLLKMIENLAEDEQAWEAAAQRKPARS